MTAHVIRSIIQIEFLNIKYIISHRGRATCTDPNFSMAPLSDDLEEVASTYASYAAFKIPEPDPDS
jgi:hypothetical protein